MAGGDDFPVRMLPEHPRREVTTAQLRFSGARRHHHEQTRLFTVLHVAHETLKAPADVLMDPPRLILRSETLHEGQEPPPAQGAQSHLALWVCFRRRAIERRRVVGHAESLIDLRLLLRRAGLWGAGTLFGRWIGLLAGADDDFGVFRRRFAAFLDAERAHTLLVEGADVALDATGVAWLENTVTHRLPSPPRL